MKLSYRAFVEDAFNDLKRRWPEEQIRRSDVCVNWTDYLRWLSAKSHLTVRFVRKYPNVQRDIYNVTGVLMTTKFE